jgi:hypothetical protein
LLQGFYDVQIDVPVGDIPRQADVVLLRRTNDQPLPFRGIWRHLTPWNALEYKGPAVSARLEHIHLLVELGLGIWRRLNEERRKNKQATLAPAEMSFWYLPHHVGIRLLKRATRLLGTLQPQGQGLWRGQVLQHPLWVVSGAELPLEAESVPFHLLEIPAPDHGLSIARLIAQQPALWDMYTQFLGSLHPEILQEIAAMGRTSKKGPQFHLKPLAQLLGMREVIQQLGLKEIIAEAGVKKVIDEVGVKKVIDEVLSHLSEADRAALMRRLEAERPKK